MAGSDEDRGRSRRLGVEDREWPSTGQVLSGWTIERSDDAVCGLHHTQGDEERMFLGLASKPRLAVSPSSASKPVATILVVWPQNHSLGFLSLGLKTGRCGLVIWPTKSPRRFLGLDIKTKWAMVYRLHHKTDGRIKTVWDMPQDLAACFTWKVVRPRFPNLASRLVEVQHGWCM
jgi:hypothetical protein